MERNGMRVLITGVDEQGRSCVVREEDLQLVLSPGDNGFWYAAVHDTTATPPQVRPEGSAAHMDLQLPPGMVRWLVVDYKPHQMQDMHSTDTVDLNLVLQGSIELILDVGTHVLSAGDAVIMNGVGHAWKGGQEGGRISILHIGTVPRS